MIRTISTIACVFAVVLGSSACSKDSPFCRMRQGEAKADLNALHEAQTKFHERTGRFARSLDELGWMAPDPNYYDVSIESASAEAYVGKALGKRTVAGDEWRIDQLGNPVVTSNACQ